MIYYLLMFNWTTSENNLPINIQANMALQPLLLLNFSDEYNKDIDIFISQLLSYLVGTTQINTSNSFRNPSIAYNYANTAGNNAVTIDVFIILAEAFTKDWHLAEKHLLDRPANTVNANNANPIVFGNIWIAQALYWLRNEYPIITKKALEFVLIFKPDLPPKLVIKNVKVDSDDELANLIKKQLKLHIAKAVKKATKAQYCCSNYNRTGHNSYKYSQKKKSKSKNKKEINPNNLKSKKRKQSFELETHSSLAKRIKRRLPILYTSSAKNYREPASEISDSDDEFIDDPMEIDFVQRKDLATDIVTTKCKINQMIKVVNFTSDCIIYSDFAVVKYSKLMLILPNTLLDKYNYDLLASRWKLKLVCNGKEFFILINMHKVKNNLKVNCATVSQNNISLVSDQISQKKWHTPVDFNIDSDDLTFKNKCISYKELEKSLYTTLKSKAEINDLCEKLQCISYTKSKTKNVIKFKKIRLLESIIKILEAELENIKSSLSQDPKGSLMICFAIISEDDEKNISKFDNIFVISKLIKNLSQYFIYRKSIDQAGKISTISLNISSAIP
ncbi:5645_t:CDS:10 [Cetraspora pellucida]|uniref:5645_t:CDS:1 n=1 Tax=Cetraspora pellucida TaxID=1433469 RepID=A0A9N9GZT8_9GLOM|nr:5645_t:CDS:10 [Cetraspora pellucida]